MRYLVGCPVVADPRRIGGTLLVMEFDLFSPMILSLARRFVRFGGGAALYLSRGGGLCFRFPHVVYLWEINAYIRGGRYPPLLVPRCCFVLAWVFDSSWDVGSLEAAVPMQA